MAAQVKNDPKRCTRSSTGRKCRQVEARSIRRMKRKFTGNRYTRITNSPESELSATEKTAKNREDSISEASSGDDCKQTPSSAKRPSASVKKLGEQSDFSDSYIEDVPESIEGFRFVDISILASVFQPCLQVWPCVRRGQRSKERVCFSSCC